MDFIAFDEEGRTLIEDRPTGNLSAKDDYAHLQVRLGQVCLKVCVELVY